jgi:hypothetical protein
MRWRLGLNSSGTRVDQVSIVSQLGNSSQNRPNPNAANTGRKFAGFVARKQNVESPARPDCGGPDCGSAETSTNASRSNGSTSVGRQSDASMHCASCRPNVTRSAWPPPPPSPCMLR